MSGSDHLSRVDEDFGEEFPGAEAAASECYVNVIRAGDGLLAELSRRLRHEAGLSTTALMLLATTDGLGGRSTPAEIGEHVPITSAAITSLVDTAEQKGLVQRLPYPGDRRKVQVVLTDEGKELIDRLLPGVHQLETEVMSVLTPREKATLLELLEKVQRSVHEAAAQPPSLAEGPRNRPDRLDHPTEE